ncbi:serine hydrolase [Olivibacter sp. XZL3]|uniref:serine hydrolase domain-containing protein n=1 Tax=Olivibacter sp. XZL3 TaxID=1735116 RepID=UPI001416F875|nr:serine hydrolase domain-containing protein [Olivibacter sp. XZL3]
MSDSNAVGLSIAIYENGKNYIYSYGEFEKGTGMLISEDRIFNLGSLAKTFVGLMLAEAVIEKKVNLDDDIRQYLPGKYPNLEYKGHPVKLKDIANHTSALPKSSRTFPKITLDSLDNLPLAAQFDFYDRYNQDSLLKDMHNFQLDTIPGSKYDYNNNAMTILILLLERIFEKPYENLVTAYLKGNLKLYDTKTKIQKNELDRFLLGYKSSYEPVRWLDHVDRAKKEINTIYFYPGGPSMNSTMNDMLKYVIANVREIDPAIKLAHEPTFTRFDSTGIGLG